MSGTGETFIIDGYNLLHRAFSFLEVEDLQEARRRLEVRLREFLRTGGSEKRIVLVYDGAGDFPGLPGGPRAAAGLEVIFTKPPRTADEEIMDQYRRLSGEGTVIVITSDLKAIQILGRGLQIRHWTAEEFAEILDEAMSRPSPQTAEASATPPAAEKPSPEEMPVEEVEEWLRIFSEPKGPRKPPGEGRKKRGPAGQ